MTQFWAAAVEICLWQLAIVCQEGEEAIVAPDKVEDWSLISSRNLPGQREAKKLTFLEIQCALEEPRRYKQSLVVKGEMDWTWAHFERAQHVPEDFPGNLLQPKGAREWAFEPGVVS
jgi:hypothetical protein